MTTIKLYNTAKRAKEVFEPLDPENVRMYVCGPTVYDRAHLGNARPVLVFDVLNRLLRHVYGADHVKYVRNFTDVDDRINATALARKEAGDGRSLEELIHERSDETIGWYHADMDALGAMRPDEEPRATEFVPQMVAMIVGLIAKGHAYEAEGHVLFAVESYTEYGALSGRSVDDMIAGARVEVAPYKRNPMDFVLWKPSTDDLPGWDSPWGRGRPGWHIECSAMADEILMKGLPEDKKSFDIHGGGNDLTFPHHENEIAQSKCAHPEGEYARYWMHNEMLQVEGKKMSKSLGNFFTVRDLLNQGVPGEVIRFVMLSTHYRKPMDWTERKREEAEKTLRKWRDMTNGVAPSAIDSKFLTTIADDLNTSAGLTRLHKLADIGLAEGLKASAQMIGLLEDQMGSWTDVDNIAENIAECVEYLLKARTAARLDKEWIKADIIRDGFKEAGIRIVDNSDGPTWSIEKDELDSLPYFQAVRSAYLSGSENELTKQLEMARKAGVHFSGRENLDVSPAWRGKPEMVLVEKKLNTLKKNLEALK